LNIKLSKRIWLSGLVLFSILSLTDFAQTYVLIGAGDGSVYEANPVANAWLQQHGWSGLAAFKLGAVVVFLGAASLLMVRRPRTGAGVLALGCSALLLVTIYSSQLIANVDRPREVAQFEDDVDLDTYLSSPREFGPRGDTESAYPRTITWPPAPVLDE
jgi:hypothetical protein